MSGRHVVQSVAHNGVILYFQLTSIFKDQHRRRLIGSLRGSRFRRSLSDRLLRFVGGRPMLGIGLSRTAAVKDRRPAVVLLGRVLTGFVPAVRHSYRNSVGNGIRHGENGHIIPEVAATMGLMKYRGILIEMDERTVGKIVR